MHGLHVGADDVAVRLAELDTDQVDTTDAADLFLLIQPGTDVALYSDVIAGLSMRILNGT
jgi:anaerobic selenocysteine-containing dehydrogenase